MTLKEIAKQANVSVSTVSRVLNGSAKISQPITDKIMQIAQTTGYLDKFKNKNKNQSLFHDKHILLIAPRNAVLNQSGNTISYTLIESLRQLCHKQNINLSSMLTYQGQNIAERLQQTLAKQKFEAVILVWTDNKDLLALISDLKIPSILINGEDRSMTIDSVGFSNRYGAMMAVEYLLSKGHQNIGLLSYKGRQTIYLRESGYRDSLYNAGIPFNSDFYIQCKNYSDQAAEQAVDSWLKTHKRLPFSALFCVTDGLALGAILALQKRGYRVPEDVSVIGMDGIFSLDLVEPKLTTIKLPFDALPYEALKMLESQSNTQETLSYRKHLELSCELIERDSVHELLSHA